MSEARKLRTVNLFGVPADQYLFRGNRILLSREEGKWHMSISHEDRYPHWDDIRDARYELLPGNITMAMLLPPLGEYVNIHPNCFHLHEIEGESESLIVRP